MCVKDAAGKKIASFSVDHSADSIAILVGRLARFGDSGGIPVGIVRLNGRLVDVLLEASYPVVPVSPNAIRTWRGGEADGTPEVAPAKQGNANKINNPIAA